jgi:hypothetical protein
MMVRVQRRLSALNPVSWGGNSIRAGVVNFSRAPMLMQLHQAFLGIGHRKVTYRNSIFIESDDGVTAWMWIKP